jgi:hypothetical protein
MSKYRYAIEEITLDDDHPLWPGETFWKIFNISRAEWGLAMYASKERAEYWLNKKMGV